MTDQSQKARDAAQGTGVSDEDWNRALDCAMSCLRPEFTKASDISRAEIDNEMQHAFGMLSLRKAAPPKPAPEAMRKALVAAKPFVQSTIYGSIQSRREMTQQIYGALSAPPADGAIETAAPTFVDASKMVLALLVEKFPGTFTTYGVGKKSNAFAENVADAILSLPVPPGAGEREAVNNSVAVSAKWEARFNKVEHQLQSAVQVLYLADEFLGTLGIFEYNHVREAIRALSRQAPHSSSEDKR